MRLIGTFKNVRAAHELSKRLTGQGIDNQCEDAAVTDWGSAEYGDRFCRLWILDEDRLQDALAIAKSYETEGYPDPIQSMAAPKPVEQASDVETLASIKRRLTSTQQQETAPQQPLGPVTRYLILLCALLYFWSVIETPPRENIPGQIPRSSIIVASPVLKALLYDYPRAYQILDEFVALAQKNHWKADADVTPAGEALVNEFSRTPFWRGFYAIAIQYLKGDPWRPSLHDPRFEKIRGGEVWRLITPVLLHSDLIHIVFNMLWLLILGKQMELRLGIWRYLLFCLVVGVFSNTMQYLMSGPNFIGFSGILCGMLAYIWVRQRKAPWEGYQLQSGTFLFLTVFVFAMLTLQLVSFVDEVYWHQGIAIGIANTAHFSGAFAGYVLGRFLKTAGN
jgi:GlpG protein